MNPLQGYPPIPDSPTPQAAPQQPQQQARPMMHSSAVSKWAMNGEDGGEMDRIKHMLPGSAPGTAQVPFKSRTSREAYLSQVKGAGIPKLADKAPIMPVRLDELTAIQPNVNMEKLQQHARDPMMHPPGSRAPSSGMPIDRPIVVQKGGKKFIHDGHHRLTVAKLRGSDEALVRYVDLDAPQKP